MSCLTIFSVSVWLASFVIMIQVFRGARKMKKLEDVALPVALPEPLVSIIVPACNEAMTLEPALRSLLQQDYVNVEIIVVDDRSIDTTFAVLTRLREEFPKIEVEHIRELPAGWLGKNHALYQGAKKAKGEILLFTDADVVMEPSTLSRSVRYLQQEKLDHLALIFQNIARGGLLNAMVVDALGGLFLFLRPWDVSTPGSKAFIGVGAFNMIRSKAYWLFGGHTALQMHPIDDMMLGKKVKRWGLKQGCLFATAFVRVQWYETVSAMVQGLMKNIFALYSYKISFAVLGILGIVIMTIVPFWGVLLAPGPGRVFFAAALLCRFVVFSCHARGMQARVNGVFWSLLTPYLTVFIIVKGVWITQKLQGIDWRGTHYSLKELKAQEQLLAVYPGS